MKFNIGDTIIMKSLLNDVGVQDYAIRTVVGYGDNKYFVKCKNVETKLSFNAKYIDKYYTILKPVSNTIKKL